MNNPKSSNYKMEKLKGAWSVEKQTKTSCWACFFKSKPQPKPKTQPQPEPEPAFEPQTEIEVLQAQMRMFQSLMNR